MRLLTKAEACRELRLSLSTLNRRIAAGEVPVKREPRGRRHRVYVMLDGARRATAWLLTRRWRWPRSGFAAWRGRWACCRDSLKWNGSATANWWTS